MQIGKRWPAGTQPPAPIPIEMVDEIARAESENARLRSGMWTLTFLERRPIATHDSGAVIDLADESDGDDDDWLR